MHNLQKEWKQKFLVYNAAWKVIQHENEKTNEQKNGWQRQEIKSTRIRQSKGVQSH